VGDKVCVVGGVKDSWSSWGIAPRRKRERRAMTSCLYV
jgi:hypothetical protein